MYSAVERYFSARMLWQSEDHFSRNSNCQEQIKRSLLNILDAFYPKEFRFGRVIAKAGGPCQRKVHSEARKVPERAGREKGPRQE